MLIRSPQGLGCRQGPALVLLVALGVAVECALEIAERDDEAGPPIQVAALEEEMLDECPSAMRERTSHADLPGGKFAGAEGGIPVHLADDLLQIAERELPDRGLKLPEGLGGQQLVALMHGVVAVADGSLAKELRLPKIRVPARASDPAPHHVVAPGNEIGVVSGRR